MSLEGQYTTNIVATSSNFKESACMDILQRAMKKLTEEHGGRLDTYYLDSRGQKRNCILSVITDDFPLGIGAVTESDGRVVFRYESYGDNRGLGKRLSNEINQNYNVIALMWAQRKLGFNVTVAEKRTADGRKVVSVTGVR